jgi:iron complex outermembrane receptor protein
MPLRCIRGKAEEKGVSQKTCRIYYYSIFRRKRDEYLGSVSAAYISHFFLPAEPANMRNLALILFSFTLLGAMPFSGLAQRDTIRLQEVTIQSDRSELFMTGKPTVELDSSVISSGTGTNLGELLTSYSSLFVKSYGAGSSAVLSSRGTEARHNSVLWNGFNLNTPGMGLTDLSLIPVSGSGKINIIRGGSSPVNGNASVGSTILLARPEPKFYHHRSVGIAAEAGSFSSSHLESVLRFSNPGSSSQTTVFHDRSQNDFSYVNLAHRDKPVQQLEHAGINNYGLIHYSDFKAGTKGVLSASAWYQVTGREIPPMMTDPSSRAEQRDSILRVHAGYKTTFGNSSIRVNAAHFREDMRYDDPEFIIHKKYSLYNSFADAEYRWYGNEKLIISAGAQGNFAKAGFEEYDSDKERNILSGYTAMIWQPVNKWKFNFNLRTEIANQNEPPVCPSIGVEGNIYKNAISLLFHAGRHYSMPSMNDLYWNPGGNVNLLPEDAWSIEGGLAFLKENKKYPSLSLTVFHSTVDNWIRWIPVNGGIYVPHNISEVKTRGSELNSAYSATLSNWKFSYHFSYSLSRSEVIKTAENNSQDIIGKQLMYSPEHLASLLFTAAWKSVGMDVTWHYTGRRFTTADNLRSLDPFHLTDLRIFFQPVIRKHQYQLTVYAKISNLFDESYEVMEWRPSPGRWFSAGVKMNFDFSKTKI